MLTMEMVLHKEVDFAPKFGKSQKNLQNPYPIPNLGCIKYKETI